MARLGPPGPRLLLMEQKVLGMLLQAVSEGKAPPNGAEMARRLGIKGNSRMWIWEVLDRLVNRGLVRREGTPRQGMVYLPVVELYLFPR